MFTHTYKGCYIHGYFDIDACTVLSQNGELIANSKSHRAAKLAITKWLKGV